MYVPSIWDYLGQAGTTGLDRYGVARDDRLDRATREEERLAAEAMQIFQTLFQGAQNGSVNAADVNSSPFAMQHGINIQAAPAEMARRISSLPAGAPSMSMMSLGIPGMAAVPQMTSTPWTDDQRRTAGLPTGDQILIEKGGAAKAKSTIVQAKFDAFEPELARVSSRYVDAALPAGPVSPRDFSLAVEGAASRAYSTWLADQSKQGELGITDPELQEYARTYFDGAVRARMKEMAELEVMGARAASYRATGTGANDDLLGKLETSLANASRDRDLRMGPFKDPQGSILSQDLLDMNAEYQKVLPTIQAIDARMDAIKQAQAALLQGRIPDNIQQLLYSGASNSAPIAGAPPPAQEPPPLASHQLDRIVLGLRQITDKAKAQQMFATYHSIMNARDRQTVASKTGLVP